MFILLVVFLIVLETLLHALHNLAVKNGYQELYAKVVNELMMLGIVSFVTFVIGASADVESSPWFKAVHFVHILTLFIGLSFILQVFFFLMTTTLYRRKLRRHEFINPIEVIDIHNKYRNNFPLFYRYFLYSSKLKYDVSFSFSNCNIGDIIEVKLIGNFFKNQYKLTSDFSFSSYIAQSYKKYVIELTHISPIIWLIALLGAATNYIRVVAIDPILIPQVCSTYDHEQDAYFGCSTYSLLVFEGFIDIQLALSLIIMVLSMYYHAQLESIIATAYEHIEDHVGFCSQIKNTPNEHYGLKILRRYFLTLGKDVTDSGEIVDSVAMGGNILDRSNFIELNLGEKHRAKMVSRIESAMSVSMVRFLQTTNSSYSEDRPTTSKLLKEWQLWMDRIRAWASSRRQYLLRTTNDDDVGFSNTLRKDMVSCFILKVLFLKYRGYSIIYNYRDSLLCCTSSRLSWCCFCSASPSPCFSLSMSAFPRLN